MSTRITRWIEYQLEHFEGLAGVVSTWAVPYTAIMLRRGICTDIEPDGMPHLIGLVLKVGSATRKLSMPDASELLQWQLAWVRDSRHCSDELFDKFTRDLDALHESHLEKAA